MRICLLTSKRLHLKFIHYTYLHFLTFSFEEEKQVKYEVRFQILRAQDNFLCCMKEGKYLSGKRASTLFTCILYQGVTTALIYPITH